MFGTLYDMFFTKRQEREKQDPARSPHRLADAILNSSSLGLFLLDSKDRIQPQVSKALSTMFRRPEVVHLSIEKLVAPLVTAKTLTSVRAFMARLLEGLPAEGENPLQDVEVRLPNPEGGFETAHYSFDFTSLENPRAWLVRVTDITARVQQQRELEDLRANVKGQAEILRGVLQAGGPRFAAFLVSTDETMKTINTVLKKPAREADAFRLKLEETLEHVDRLRRDATALKLTGLESAARNLEDALQELRVRGSLSGSDFLPLAVKLDQLFVQFSLLRTLTAQASPPRSAATAEPDARVTDNGTQIIEAPRFHAEAQRLSNSDSSLPAPAAAAAPVRRAAVAGSLVSTLTSLTELAAQEQQKNVELDCVGIELVPLRYQAAIKNVAIQLIRNAVLHGIETPAERRAAGKPVQGALQLQFRMSADQSYELLFQDDGRGIDPGVVRNTAVARGLLSEEEASGLRDRQAIKLIFKSGFTTLAQGDSSHGAGMSLVRRYVHEAGGRIALASQLGQETRFKITMPALDADEAQEVA